MGLTGGAVVVGEYTMAAGYVCRGKVEKMAAAHFGTSVACDALDLESVERGGAGGMFSSSG